MGLPIARSAPLFGQVLGDVGKLPGWLQAGVKINLVTQVSDAVRGLMLHQPASHAVAASLAWALEILVVCAPAAVLMFRRTNR